MNKKAATRSGFPPSTYVVLKTTCVNLNVHVRRYYVHARRSNLLAIRPQLILVRIGGHTTTAFSFSLRRNDPLTAPIGGKDFEAVASSTYSNQ